MGWIDLDHLSNGGYIIPIPALFGPPLLVNVDTLEEVEEVVRLVKELQRPGAMEVWDGIDLDTWEEAEEVNRMADERMGRLESYYQGHVLDIWPGASTTAAIPYKRKATPYHEPTDGAIQPAYRTNPTHHAGRAGR